LKLFNKERSHSHIPKSDRTSKILIIKAIAPPTTQKSDRPSHPKKRSHLSHPKSDRPTHPQKAIALPHPKSDRPTHPQKAIDIPKKRSHFLHISQKRTACSSASLSHLLTPLNSDRPPKSPNSDRTPTPLNSDRPPKSQKAIIRFEHRTRWYSHHCCE
jgi:hypothetical protein